MDDGKITCTEILKEFSTKKVFEQSFKGRLKFLSFPDGMGGVWMGVMFQALALKGSIYKDTEHKTGWWLETHRFYMEEDWHATLKM